MPNTTSATDGGFTPHQIPWTKELRDRQARGKDPYASIEELRGERAGGAHGSRKDEGYKEHPFRHGTGLPRETYEEREKKDFAMAVLDNPDMLLMHSLSNNDSIAGQRLRFLTMMCPVEQDKHDAEAEAAAARQEEASTKRDPRTKDRRRESGKGKAPLTHHDDED